MKRLLAFAWIALFILFLGALALVLPVLPDHMATHFDFSGRPNGFQDKSAYLSTMLVIGLMVNGIFFILYNVIGRLLDKLINLPGRIIGSLRLKERRWSWTGYGYPFSCLEL